MRVTTKYIEKRVGGGNVILLLMEIGSKGETLMLTQAFLSQ